MKIISPEKQFYDVCAECDKTLTKDDEDKDNGAQIELELFDLFVLCHDCARKLESELTNFLNTR